MLARLVRELPRDGFLYEPKWDGFRALAFRDGATVDLRSRNQRPLARYFPEVVAALLGLEPPRWAMDGEILVVRADGRADFAALMARLHPAPSRVERLRALTPAIFVAFDLLAVGDEDLRDHPFHDRRARLEGLVDDRTAGPNPGAGGVPLALTPITADPETASAWLRSWVGGGVDGVVAKHRLQPYRPGRREMLKVKHQRTAECVVAGFRWQWDRPVLGSLLLGLYDEAGGLRHAGVASSFSRERRAQILERLEPMATELTGHPWERGFGLARSPVGRLAGAAGRWAPDEMDMDWVPLRPELVCEVEFLEMTDGGKLRAPSFKGLRTDKVPADCVIEKPAG